VVTSLGFELLDRHVVGGRGDAVACSDASGPLTFAKLTERTAELAGGLHILGIRTGDYVQIDLPAGNVLVTAVCAVIRLGAVPHHSAEARILEVDGEPRVQLNDHDLELALVQRAGRADPAASLHRDPDGYRAQLGDSFAEIVETLLTGSPVV
jgi:acyl-CoA synthetase (AMP-forming)/AMP-acid ligase II